MTQTHKRWMPFFIDDFYGSTGHLSKAEREMYLRLLAEIWKRNGELPACTERLRFLARASRPEWKRSADTIMAFFTRHGDVYRQARMDKELAVSRRIIEQRSAAGQASAKAREVQRESNGRSTRRPTAEQREGQRQLNPLPVQSKKESSSSYSSLSSPVLVRDAGEVVKQPEEVRGVVYSGAYQPRGRQEVDCIEQVPRPKASRLTDEQLQAIRRGATRGRFK